MAFRGPSAALGAPRSTFEKHNAVCCLLRQPVAGSSHHIHCAIVLPKMLYNLEALLRLKADERRLGSLNAQCLRLFCRITHAYISRVSNDQMLDISRVRPLSEALCERQTSLHSKIAMLSKGRPSLRILTCQPGPSLPRIWDQCRKRGRRKQQ